MTDMIIISHRISTVKDADETASSTKHERGTHESLLDQAAYSEMYEKQLLEEELPPEADREG